MNINELKKYLRKNIIPQIYRFDNGYNDLRFYLNFTDEAAETYFWEGGKNLINKNLKLKMLCFSIY